MATGRKDHTLDAAVDVVTQTLALMAIDVAAQSLGNLAIDVAAQSLGNLGIDVAAQSLGNLAIDIAAQSAAQLDIDIEAQTIGNINIDIAAQAVDRMYILPQAPTGATTIFKSGTAAGNTAVLHTVTAGKTFYLTYANLTGFSTGAAADARLAVRNGADVTQYYLAQMRLREGEIDAGGEIPVTSTVPITITPALVIPSGWDIVMISSAGVLWASAGVGGWES